jgi:hypothetical protein
MLLVLLAGCVQTKQLYSGPKRPSSEVSTVISIYQDSLLHTIDGIDVRDLVGGHRIELAPGPHKFEIVWVLEDNDGNVKRTNFNFDIETKAGYLYWFQREGVVWSGMYSYSIDSDTKICILGGVNPPPEKYNSYVDNVIPDRSLIVQCSEMKVE